MGIFENSPELLFLCGFLVFYMLLHWLESRTNNDYLTNLMNQSEASLSLFTKADDMTSSRSPDNKTCNVNSQEQTINDLKQRIEVLEKIVTDSRYELDQKLKSL